MKYLKTLAATALLTICSEFNPMDAIKNYNPFSMKKAQAEETIATEQEGLNSILNALNKENIQVNIASDSLFNLYPHGQVSFDKLIEWDEDGIYALISIEYNSAGDKLTEEEKDIVDAFNENPDPEYMKPLYIDETGSESIERLVRDEIQYIKQSAGILNEVPSTVTGLYAEDVPDDEGGSIYLQWDANPEEDLVSNYEIYRSTEPIIDIKNLEKIASTGDLNITDPNAETGVEYHYAVTAADAEGSRLLIVESYGPVQSINNTVIIPPEDNTQNDDVTEDTPSTENNGGGASGGGGGCFIKSLNNFSHTKHLNTN